MKKVTYTTTKLILTKEEKEIKKTWDDGTWKFLLKQEAVLGYVVLITGTWSGYPGQTNCDTTSYRHATMAMNPSIHPYRGTIVFTDNTTLNVVSEKMTIEELLQRRIKQRGAYTELVIRMIQGGQGYLNLNAIEMYYED